MPKPVPPISFRRAEVESKGWGREVKIINNIVGIEEFPRGYAGKLLEYHNSGSKSSMHAHAVKHETFYILSGFYKFRWIDPTNADVLEKNLTDGDVVVIPPFNFHQLECLTAGTIIEFSSTDYSWDNHRVGKGDSQKVV